MAIQDAPLRSLIARRFAALLLLLMLTLPACAQPDLVNPPPPDFFPLYLLQLKGPETNIAVQAAERLGEMRDERAIAPLAEAMRAGDVRVRVAAILAYNQYQKKAPVEPLLALLSDPQAEVRRSVMQGLWINMIPPTALDTLLQVADDPDPDIRRILVILLRNPDFAGERVIAVLRNALHDPDVGVRASAAETLGILAAWVRDPQVVAELLPLLKDETPKVRQAAAIALVGFRDPRVVEPLLQLAQSADEPAIRAGAFRSLGNQDDPRIRPVLVVALQDGNPELRLAAMQALVQQRDPRDLELLIRLLHGENDMDSRQAIDILAHIGPTGYPALVSALKDPRQNVQSAAFTHVVWLHDRRLVDLLLAVLPEVTLPMRVEVLRLLAQFDDERVTDALLAALGAPEVKIRKIACEAFSFTHRTEDPRHRSADRPPGR